MVKLWSTALFQRNRHKLPDASLEIMTIVSSKLEERKYTIGILEQFRQQLYVMGCWDTGKNPDLVDGKKSKDRQPRLFSSLQISNEEVTKLSFFPLCFCSICMMRRKSLVGDVILIHVQTKAKRGWKDYNSYGAIEQWLLDF